MAKVRQRMNPNEIKELLLLKKWSQAELARRLDVDRAQVTRWLSGERIARGPAAKLMTMWLEDCRNLAATK